MAAPEAGDGFFPDDRPAQDPAGQLGGKFYHRSAHVIRRRQQSKDGTVKYLLQLADGNCIETVLMRYKYGNTVCVSTQVGCAMGCRFCASTQAGRVRI